MIKNDPFETREKAIKTILSGDIKSGELTDRSLYSYIMQVNDCYNDHQVREYFVNLYKKFSDDFELEITESDHQTYYDVHTLYFMNHVVISTGLPSDSVKTINGFFKCWLEHIE